MLGAENLRNVLMTLMFTIVLLMIGVAPSSAAQIFQMNKLEKTVDNPVFINPIVSINGLAKINSDKSMEKLPPWLTSTKILKKFTISSSAYTANCNGCTGITETGLNLKRNPGLKVIAVDPKVIKLGTKVYVEGYGFAIAGDIGTAIKGNVIEVFISDKQSAYKWGKKDVTITIFE